LLALWIWLGSYGAVFGATRETGRDHDLDSRRRFMKEMPLTVRADHPAILPVAAAVRTLTTDPREQLMVVHDVTHLLVDYDADERVYHRTEFHATFDEMLQRRREGGWVYLRDDCDGRAVFAAHLLSSLGIQWRLEASYWKRHAWIVAIVDGVQYDLLDLRNGDKELQAASFKYFGRLFTRPSNPPPFFHWRRAWLDKTGGDVELGLRLGMLEIDSKPGRLHERFSVDWTRRVPEGANTPADHRATYAAYAGFPYQEPLHGSSADNTQVAATSSSDNAGGSRDGLIGAEAPLGRSTASR